MVNYDRKKRFDAFVRDHRVMAIRLAWRLLGRHHAMAEDIAHRAFVKAWDKLDGFREEAKIKTWFHRILVNEVRSYLRWVSVREKARWFFTREAPTTPNLGDPGLSKRIMSAVATLSDVQREVFTLIYLEGLSIREVASVTGRAEGTIKTHSFRALQKLRAELQDLQAAH